MVKPLDQNAGRSQYVKIDDISFKMVDDFKRVGKTSTDRNSVHEKIQRSWNSGNACYHSVQNLLTSMCCSKLRYTEV